MTEKLLHETNLDTIEQHEKEIVLRESFGTHSDLARQMLMLPSVKRSIYNYMISLNAQLGITKIKMQTIENRVFAEVTEEGITVGEGSSATWKPKFTNEKARDAEKFARLQVDKEYQGLVSRSDELQAKLKESQGSMEYVSDMMSRNKALIKLLEIDRADRGGN